MGKPYNGMNSNESIDSYIQLIANQQRREPFVVYPLINEAKALNIAFELSQEEKRNLDHSLRMAELMKMTMRERDEYCSELERKNDSVEQMLKAKNKELVISMRQNEHEMTDISEGYAEKQLPRTERDIDGDTDSYLEDGIRMKLDNITNKKECEEMTNALDTTLGRETTALFMSETSASHKERHCQLLTRNPNLEVSQLQRRRIDTSEDRRFKNCRWKNCIVHE